jgi:uncharacterized membrane protein (DUF373 family)
MPDISSHPDPMVDRLKATIRVAVRALAVLMVFVIVMGVADVVWVLYQKLTQPPFLLLQISDILATFGAFMAVLIAIEIFVNITIYLREDVIHVKIVMATALMAIARKVIILDVKELSPEYLYGLAAVAAAMSVGYWLVVVAPERARRHAAEAERNDRYAELLATSHGPPSNTPARSRAAATVAGD